LSGLPAGITIDTSIRAGLPEAFGDLFRRVATGMFPSRRLAAISQPNRARRGFYNWTALETVEVISDAFLKGTAIHFWQV